MVLVRRFLNQTVDTPAAVAATAALPSSAVTMLPGNYLFAGSGYDCTAPGLYRFLSGDTINSRIVWDGDIYNFLSAVSWHHMHGIEDEALTGQYLANEGMTHKWRLRCGYITAFLVWMLPYLGFTVRQVNLLSLQTPPNGIDDGHVALEVTHGGKWKLWDVTNGCYFTDGAGEHLSAAEIVVAGVRNCVRVLIDGDLKGCGSVVDGFDMASYRDLVLRTDADTEAWFARIYQAWSA
jgi:hypothetical protein